jgi:hypothetical protein
LGQTPVFAAWLAIHFRTWSSLKGGNLSGFRTPRFLVGDAADVVYYVFADGSYRVLLDTREGRIAAGIDL